MDVRFRLWRANSEGKAKAGDNAKLRLFSTHALISGEADGNLARFPGYTQPRCRGHGLQEESCAGLGGLGFRGWSAKGLELRVRGFMV